MGELSEDAAALRRVAKLLALGNAAIFVGAGVSATSGAPLWSELVEELRSELSPVTTITGFALVAQFFRNQHGDNELVRRLRQRLSLPGLLPSKVHSSLTALGVRTFFTTNYDSLLESCFRARGEAVHVIKDDADVALWDERHEIQLVKLHGDLDSAQSLVLTSDDYAQLMFRNRALQRKLADVFTTRPVVFVGYSFQDHDIDLIYNGVISDVGAVKCPAFLLTFETDVHLLKEWRRRHIEPIVIPESGAGSRSTQLENALELLRREVIATREGITRDVLIVDDNAWFCEAVETLLSEQFVDVRFHRTNDAVEALLLIGRLRPQVVILDLVMPGFDGYGLLRVLASKPEYRDVRVIVYSGYLMVQGVRTLFESPNVADVVSKSDDTEQLVAALREVLPAREAVL